jgi:hypothetical protein
MRPATKDALASIDVLTQGVGKVRYVWSDLRR